MTPLRQKLIDEIQLRGFSPHTQEFYVRSVTGLARFYHRSPDQTSDDEIKGCLLHLLRAKKLACNSLIVAVSGVRFFFGTVLHRPTTAVEQALPRVKKSVLQLKVYSVQELEQFFKQPKLNCRHRALFMTTYAAGLRFSEVCQLRLADLLSDRHQKSITAVEMFRRHREVKVFLWGGEFWADGYYLNTVGQYGNLKMLEDYIKKQGLACYKQIHHQTLSLF